MDQLRSGLEILGLLDLMETKPHSVQHYFVHKVPKMTPTDLLLKTDFEDGTAPEKKLMFEEVVNTYDHDTIEKFLTFLSGMKNLNVLPQSQRFTVKFTDASSLYASTCTLELIIPAVIDKVALLKASLEAVMDQSWNRSFNTY